MEYVDGDSFVKYLFDDDDIVLRGQRTARDESLLDELLQYDPKSVYYTECENECDCEDNHEPPAIPVNSFAECRPQLDSSTSSESSVHIDKAQDHSPIVMPKGIKNDRRRALDAALDLPCKLAECFNIGNLEEIFNLINSFCIEDCILRSAASEGDVRGRQALKELFRALFDDYPDGVMVVKDVKLVDRYLLKHKIYFTGTIVKPPPAGEDNHIYSRGSIAAMVNQKKYTPEEIRMIAERENQLREAQKSIRIIVKGETKYHFTRDYKISRYETDYSVTSFDTPDKIEMNSSSSISSASSDCDGSDSMNTGTCLH
jgi:hypothetical protein